MTQKLSETKTAAVVTDLLTVAEAAALLKLSQVSIRRMLTQKRLRRFKIGSATRVRRSEVLSLIREV